VGGGEKGKGAVFGKKKEKREFWSSLKGSYVAASEVGILDGVFQLASRRASRRCALGWSRVMRFSLSCCRFVSCFSMSFYDLGIAFCKGLYIKPQG
jgi:hypothetical protein